MKITEKTVDKISDLAKLSFDMKEKDELIIGLNGMMSFVTTLENFDSSEERVADFSFNPTCPLADDVATPSLKREDVLSSAPLCDGSAFIVPKTVEEG
ncbi:MAG: aspartyl/glutamyl-tRNA amidotransferase subunit C [Clostridia bacterium]|nr:aspartyl/glutamyl-tRNA amidotransferase subunit C [Clostridia bacterium]